MKRGWLLIIGITLLLSGCNQEFEGHTTNFFSGKDRLSPRLIDIEPIDATTIVFSFDETVFRPYIILEKEFKQSTCTVDKNTLIVYLSNPLDVMNPTNIYFSVKDNMNNSTTMEVPVYGLNYSIPTLIINEFSTRGSSSNPDRVELKALSDGNLAGITLYHGMFYNHTHSFSFPAVDVKQDDYIVIQYQQVPQEISSLLYFGGSEGLGGNNGIISLYSSPYDDIVDAVLYSNRTSDSDELYGGFGTREVYDQVLELTPTEQWVHHGIIPPESAIPSEDSTATRSFNRKEGEDDTNSSGDWYITQTSGATFGGVNNRTIYTP